MEFIYKLVMENTRGFIDHLVGLYPPPSNIKSCYNVPYRFSFFTCIIYTSPVYLQIPPLLLPITPYKSVQNTMLENCGSVYVTERWKGLNWWSSCSCNYPMSPQMLCVTEGADSQAGTDKGKWLLEGELVQMPQLQKRENSFRKIHLRREPTED